MTGGQTPPINYPLSDTGLTVSQLEGFDNASRVKMVPGGLSTRLDKTAISPQDAQSILNCNTDSGVWKLDKRYRQCQPSPNGSNTVRAFGYGVSYQNGDFYTMQQGDTVYDLTAGWADSGDALWGGAFNGATTHWNSALTPVQEAEDFYTWEHQGNLFFASETNGYVRYKPIGSGPIEKLYLRYDLENSDGISLERPPYPRRLWDAGDTITQPTTAAQTTHDWVSSSIASGQLSLLFDDQGSYYWGVTRFKAAFAASLDWSNINYIGMRMGVDSGSIYRNFDWGDNTYCFMQFHDTGSGVVTTLKGTTKIMFRQVMSGVAVDCYVLFDLSNVANANKDQVDYSIWSFYSTMDLQQYLKFDGLYYGGTFFHDRSANGGIIGKSPNDTPSVEYGYTFDGTGGGGASGTAESVATKVDCDSTLHMGNELYPPISGVSGLSGTSFATRMFMGSRIKLDISAVGAPYNASDKINIYRKIIAAGGATRWQRLTQLTNSGSPTYTDYLKDSTVYDNTGTYPVLTPVFGDYTGNNSGEIKNVICGCSWRGSNVYFSTNGKAYFSQQGNFKKVLWDGVNFVLQPDDPSRPRTLTVSDTASDAIITAIPNNALYMFSRRAVYAMTGPNPAEADEPRKMPSLQGCLGKRSAHSYQSGAVYAADTGLYYIEVGSIYTGKPGESVVQELTREVSPTWATLIGTATERVQTVVCCYDNEIYVFCQNRYMRLTKQGKWIYGEYQSADKVYAAVSDPRRGVVVALTTGKVANVGAYVTDLGTNTAGDNGTAPSWNYYTKRFVAPISLMRALCYYSSTGVTPSLSIKGYTSRNTSPGTLSFTTSKRLPFEQYVGKETNGDWFEIYISGDNKTTLHSLELEIGHYQEGGSG